MQLSNFVKQVINSSNNQSSFVIKKKELKKFGLTASSLLKARVPIKKHQSLFDAEKI